MVAHLAALSIAFAINAPKLGVGLAGARRAPAVFLCDAESADGLDAAARRVVDAARSFGEAQGEAAEAWVEEATSSKSADPDELLEKQLGLFEECIIRYDVEDGDGQPCKELDDALGALDELLLEGPNPRDSKLDRALLRVRSAAAKIGVEEGQVAELWTEKVRAQGVADPAALLEQQHLLFSECILEEGESSGPSAKCIELQASLAALQKALGIGGRVVSTRGFSPADLNTKK
jgi:hypothetical protein